MRKFVTCSDSSSRERATQGEALSGARSVRRAAQRRQAARGAVFVEAIIVSALLIIFLASGIFFHRLYSSKLQATREARVGAWLPASAGCASGLGFPQIWGFVVTAADSAEDAMDMGGLHPESNTPPDWLAVGSQVGSPSGAPTVRADSVIGGGSFSPQAYNRVICNEIAQSERGDLGSVMSYMWSAIIP